MVGILFLIKISCRFLVPVFIGNITQLCNHKIGPQNYNFLKKDFVLHVTKFPLLYQACLGAERENRRNFLPGELVNKLSPNLSNQDMACL